MKKTNANKKLKILMVALLLMLIGVAAATGVHTYRQKLANESFDEIDIHSMHEFSYVNSEKVLQAIKDGSRESLEKLMVSSEGLDGILSFADWSSMDIENAVSMGSGTLSVKPDSKGRIDVSERFIVEASDSRYVFFIETLTSRWGRKNEGVSAIGVTSFGHFNDIDYNWSGQASESSALAGKLFWQDNQ